MGKEIFLHEFGPIKKCFQRKRKKVEEIICKFTLQMSDNSAHTFYFLSQCYNQFEIPSAKSE